MSDSDFSEGLDWLWRISLAQTLILVLFFIGVISLSQPLADEVRPYFLLMAVYYWAIYRPTLLHPLQIFIFGLLFDILLALPVGGHAFLFLFVHWVIQHQRLYFLSQTYLVVWIGFALTCFSICVLEWLIYSALKQNWLPLIPILSTFVVSVLVFPVVSLLFVGVLRILPVAPHSNL